MTNYQIAQSFLIVETLIGNLHATAHDILHDQDRRFEVLFVENKKLRSEIKKLRKEVISMPKLKLKKQKTVKSKSPMGVRSPSDYDKPKAKKKKK